MRVTGGNVGIGTTAPGALLDVAGAIKLSGTDNILLNGNWLSGDGGDEGLYVDSSGNVGIGTTDTIQKLKVAGQIVTDSRVSDGLVGFWQFDESTGSPADSSGYGNTGTRSGALGTNNTPAYTSGKFGNALNFDGTDDSVAAANESRFDFNRTDAFSMFAWVNTSSGNIMQLFNKGNNTWGPGIHFSLNSNVGGGAAASGRVSARLISSWASNLIGVYADIPFNDGKWHLLGMTYDGSGDASGVKIYLDGKAQTTVTGYNTLTGSILNNNSLTIGSNNGAEWYFNGKIDEPRVYKRRLAADEVAALYSASPNKFAEETYFTSNVGIGTTSPDRTLEVLNASNPQLRLTQADSSVYTDFQMNSSGDLLINVDGATNQLVLDDSGNVGIGLANPSYNLEVTSATVENPGRISLLRNDSAIATDDTIGALLFRGIDSSVRTAAEIRARALATWGSNTADAPTQLEFYTQSNNSGGDSLTSPRMVINDLGNVGIGTSAPLSLLHLGNGDVSTGTNGKTQIAFGYNNTNNYAHFIRSRHSSGVEGNALDFYVSDGTPAGTFASNKVHGLTIDSGNIGIGTTDPDDKFHIKTAGSNSIEWAIKLQNPDNTVGSATGIGFMVNTGTDVEYKKGAIVYERRDTSGRGTFHILQNATDDGTNASLSDAALSVLNSGNVGIGTTSPDQLFHVSAGTAIGKIESTSNNSGATLQLKGNLFGNNYPMGTISTYGDTTEITRIESIAGNSVSDTSIAFYARGSTGLNEIMRIKGTTGNVGIGTSTPAAKAEVLGTSTQLRLAYDASNYANLAVGSTGNVTVTTNAGDTFSITDGTDSLSINFTDSSLAFTDGTNSFTFDADSGTTLAGTARPTRQVTLSPEFPGATLTGDGSSNTGTMTSDFCEQTASTDIPDTNTSVCDTAGDIHNYYSWTTAEASAQDYDIWIRWRVPDNFSAWASSNPVKVFGKRTDITNNAVNVYIYDTVGTVETNANGAQVAGTTWTQTSISSLAGTYTAGSYMTIRIKVTADTSDSVQVGEINLDYLTTN